MTIEIDGDKLDENTLFSLRENHTVRVSTLLTPDEFTWSRDEAEGRGVSQSAYIRELIRQDRRKVEMSKLSAESLGVDTPESAQILYKLARLIKDQRV
ncbi:hypothetical protein [Nitrosovibrio sp. Nv4]|uniref:hypothetical protein n=1 Tax=Nitrosovibrio sp. Nv4 TaxID=1945880 RepID=UPI000BD2F0E3|nr:hypothetical protein [Nitrosovibrio sp. Nv4]SOD42403.1 hypothetical protein SAMN06298226_2742 [Nitrosovibrio sp. Nv4]